MLNRFTKLVAKPNQEQFKLISLMQEFMQNNLTENYSKNTFETTTYSHTIHDTIHDDNTQIKSSLQGFYIHGSVGSGKTKIMDIFHDSINQLSSTNFTSSRYHFHEFMQQIHHRLYLKRLLKSQSGDLLPLIGNQLVQESKILCLDEMQVTDIADAMILKRLFTGIFNSGGILITTSNRHPSNLYENGINRSQFIPFIDMILQKCLVFDLSSSLDYRSSKTPSSQKCYFVNDSSNFMKLLEKESHGIPMTSHNLPIPNLDRSLKVLASSQSKNNNNLIVYSTFDELCNSNLSSSDYFTLFKHTKLLFLDQVPLLSDINTTRRFIVLVDASYESKVRIIINSSHPLHSLFTHLPKLIPQTPKSNVETRVVGQGGSSSSHATTYTSDSEWSATGLLDASLANGGAGASDVYFAASRARSRLVEMSSKEWD